MSVPEIEFSGIDVNRADGNRRNSERQPSKVHNVMNFAREKESHPNCADCTLLRRSTRK
jgi:hypothetical protein